MHRNCIRYKDTMAAPGSKLHEALTARDMAAAEKIYQTCEKDARNLIEQERYRNWPPKGLWDGMIPQGTLRGHCEYALAGQEKTK
jgi:hypothetical protein